MPVTTTEKKKSLDLSKVEAAPKDKKITSKKITEERFVEKKANSQEAISKVSSSNSLNSKLSSKKSSKKETTKEKAAAPEQKVSVRTMVQDANQWRNCRRPHRI